VASKIVLGTANFGNPYGVLHRTTTSVFIDQSQARRILEAAKELGIDEIDTAYNYGPAHEWLAKFTEDMSFKINTKIPWKGVTNFSYYSNLISEISQNFSSDSINLIQWHNWEYSNACADDIHELHDRIWLKKSKSFGATTYGPSAAIEALKIPSFTALQIEFNILNQAAAKAVKDFQGVSETKIYFRSIMLQGLLSKHGLNHEVLSLDARAAVKKLADLAKNWSMELEEIAIRSAYLGGLDADIVVGVNSEQQLFQNFEFLNRGPLPVELSRQLLLLDLSKDESVDPRNWT
jgi:aryl-alcohol dehydrogenase-like predicted oxidoreductase